MPRHSALCNELTHGQEIEDTLFDVFETIVVRVENLLGYRQIEAVRRPLRPGQPKDPIEIGAHDGCFGGNAGHPFETREFTPHPLLDLGGEAAIGDLLPEHFDIILRRLAKLVVNRFQLLAQIVFALIFVDLLPHPVFDFLFKINHFQLTRQDDGELLQPLQLVRLLKERLPDPSPR